MTDSKSLIRLSTDLANMFLESTDTECELVTSSGDHLPVHSVLFKARSSYFRAPEMRFVTAVTAGGSVKFMPAVSFSPFSLNCLCFHRKTVEISVKLSV